MPPEPLMTPLKSSLALDSVSVRLPSKTLPVPPKRDSVAPLPVPLMSRTPLLVRPLLLAMLPAPPSASVAPLPTVVVPV
ncbi:hypothetical protein CHC07_03281 [Variovorax sp. B4]|nr:hypothetical protein CHC06_04234 [Variovorax sp. B2]PNG53466.1 hypothetical protein CHC07_03281 [Variovorax sp. B4]